VRAERAVIAAVILLAAPPSGLPADIHPDRDQPIYVEADSAVLREKEGYSRYHGNVLLRQGALEMHGDTMTVYNSDDNIDRIILTGTPATIAQHAEGSDRQLNAEAAQMEYSAAAENIVLTGAARVWQADGKEFRSERITYNIRTGIVNAGDGASGDRVHITLQPKTKSGDDEKTGSE